LAVLEALNRRSLRNFFVLRRDEHSALTLYLTIQPCSQIGSTVADRVARFLPLSDTFENLSGSPTLARLLTIAVFIVLILLIWFAVQLVRGPSAAHTGCERPHQSDYAAFSIRSRTCVRYAGPVGTWHDPDVGRPIAEPLPRPRPLRSLLWPTTHTSLLTCVQSGRRSLTASRPRILPRSSLSWSTTGRGSALDATSAWAAGQSSGGNIVLRLAGERPDLLRGITAHEPPLFSLVAGDPAVAPMLEGFGQTSAAVGERIASGDHAGAAEKFVEETLGQGMWDQLPPEDRQAMIENAPTFLDEANDPDQVAFQLEWISGFPRPVLLTQGDQSPPLFPPVITKIVEALPSAEVSTFTGVGHIPHVEDPEAYVEAITAFAHKHTT
jgi:pimeloyl-ACP methyl ester carboxylesterase